MKKTYLYFMALAHFSCDINTGVLPGLLPFFVALYSMDYKLAAGLMFASSFLSSIIQPLIGYWSDKKTNTYLMALGVLLSGLSLGATALWDNYIFLFAAVTLMGIGNAIFHPEAAKLVNGLAGQQKALGMSIFSTGGSCGFCAGPILGATLAAIWGLQAIAVFAVWGILMGILIWFLTPRMKQSATIITQKSVKQQTTELINDWSSFRRLTMFVIIRAGLYTALMTFLPLYCVYTLGQGEAVGSFSLTLLAAVGIFTNWLGGYAADRWGNTVVLRLSMFLTGIAMIAFNLNQNLLLMYLLVGLAGFALYASIGPMVVLGQTYLAKNIGMASGVTLGIGFSAGGVIAPILGWVADTYGLDYVFYLLPIMALLGIIATFSLKEK